TPIPEPYVKEQMLAGKSGSRLLAIVAEGTNGRIYLSPSAEHEGIAAQAKPTWSSDEEIPYDPHSGATWCVLYGLKTFGDLFTSRQLVALTTFSALVQEVRDRVNRAAQAAGLPADGKPLRDCGAGAAAYADALAIYLAFALSRSADRGSSICSWDSSPKM